MATATKKELVEIKPIEVKRVKVRLVGDTPLITHVWSEKARKEIRDKELGLIKKSKARPIRKPVKEAVDSLYWLKGKPSKEEVEAVEQEHRRLCEEGEVEIAIEKLDNSSLFKDGYILGFPCAAIRISAVSAAYRREWTKDKVSTFGVFRIEGWDEDAEIEDALLEKNWVRIHGDKPIFREDNVVVGISSADLRYRAQIDNWWADVVIAYDANSKYSLEQIVNFLNVGGFSCGIGEWRTEKTGNWGAFHVEEIQ